MLPSTVETKSNFSYRIETLGCKANLTDSAALASRLEKLGGVRDSNPDIYILNSCTVTDRADRDAIALLKKQKAKICVLTGCLAEVNPSVVKKFEQENNKKVILARNSGKQDLPRVIAELAQNLELETESVLEGDRSEWHRRIDHEELSPLEGGVRTRAFLKVQDGCNQFCSYCIIPHARGRSRSLSLEKILTEIHALEDAGVQEVVLTAIHAADYEYGVLTFTQLVKKILEQTKIPRVRLTSLDPAEIHPELLELMVSEPRLCSHLHVSLQSGSTRVLRAMQRNYDAVAARRCLENIYARVPSIFVGMDMIAGFPGETKIEHEETLALLRDTPWTRLHVFPYSVRRSTKAAEMVKQGLGVEEREKIARAKELRGLSDIRLAAELEKKHGKLMEVLVEEKRVERDGIVYSQGHARNYFSVLVKGDLPINSLARAQITGVDAKSQRLLGEMV